MKCKECGSKLDITTENIMIFDYETLYKCDVCHACYSEEEISKELEKVYWEGRNMK